MKEHKIPAFFSRDEWPWNTPLFKNFERDNAGYLTEESGQWSNFPPANIFYIKSTPELAPESKADGMKEAREAYEPFYIVEMALAGYSKHRLDLTVHNDTVRVRSFGQEDKTDWYTKSLNAAVTTISNQIANRKFERLFKFGAPVEVTDATFEGGMLKFKVRFKPPVSGTSIKIE